MSQGKTLNIFNYAKIKKKSKFGIAGRTILIRAEIDKTENRKTIVKINETKIRLFE